MVYIFEALNYFLFELIWAALFLNLGYYLCL
jgi:hypothetical protein